MKPSERDRVLKTLLQLAERQGWSKITFKKLALASKTAEEKIRASYPSVEDLIPDLVPYFSALAAKGMERGTAGNVHDVLFDALMARFDVLQTHRKAVTGLRVHVKKDARLWSRIAQAEKKAMHAILAHAGIGAAGPRGCARLAGLMLVYAAALQVWLHDEAVDISKTMAALDKYLRWASYGERLLPGFI